jgi:hypothetical protein
MKLFTAVIYEWAIQARVFFHGKPFRPSLILEPIRVKLLSGATLLGNLPEDGSLNKRSCLAPALGFSKFITARDMISVTLCCAT